MAEPKLADYYNKEWGDLPEIDDCYNGHTLGPVTGPLPHEVITEWGLSSPDMYNTMQIEKRDMSLFGQFPSLDVMDFVECNDCGKTLKVESLGAHYDRRHNPKSVIYKQPRTRCWGLNYNASVFVREPPSDDSNSSFSGSSSSYLDSDEEAVAHKRRRIDDSTSYEKKGHQKERIETLKIKVPTATSVDAPSLQDVTSAKGTLGNVVTFHPDKHCGVWLIVEKRRCLRSLTCKLHSILLKRKIEGRSRPYDELMRLRKVKIEMEAAAGTSTQISNSSSASSSSRSSVTEAIIEKSPEKSPTLTNVTPPPDFTVLKMNPRELFYTATHPNPLALCSFNVKRIGGVVFCSRSKGLTEKLVNISLHPPIGQNSKTKKLSLIELRMIKSIWPAVINDGLLFNVKRVRSIASTESRVPDLNDDNNNLSEEVMSCRDASGVEEEVVEEVVFTIDAGPLDLDNGSWVTSCVEELSGLAGRATLEDSYIVIDDLTEEADRAGDNNVFSQSQETIHQSTSSTWEDDSKEEVVNVEDVVSVDHIDNFSDPTNYTTDEKIFSSLKVTKPKKRKRKRWF